MKWSKEHMHKSFSRFCARRFVTMGSTSTASTRGALIVFEGCDRSGKTTQCQQLVKSLNSDKIDAEYCRFPGLFFVDTCHKYKNKIIIYRFNIRSVLCYHAATGSQARRFIIYFLTVIL